MNDSRGESQGSTGVALRPAWIMTSATNLLLGLVAFSVAPLAARLLGPEGRGRLVAVQLVPQLLADLAALGLGFSIVHFGARHRESLAVFIRWSMMPLLIGSTVMMVTGFALSSWVTDGMAEDERLMRLYLLLCPITAFSVVLLEGLRALGDFRAWNVMVLLRGLSWPIALIIGVTRPGASLGVVVVLHLGLMTGLLVCVAAIMVRRARAQRSEPDVDRGRFIRYGLTSAVSTVPRSANARLDQVVMSAMVGRENLGLYAAASGWSALTIPVMRGLTGITMPHLSAAVGGEQLMRTRQLITFGVAAIAVLSVVGVVFTLLLWGPLYGPEYRSALGAAVVLIPAALLLEFNSVLGNVLNSLDRPGLVAVLESVIMVASTGALLIVLRADEVMGPAIVSLGTYALASVGYAVYIARRLEVSFRHLIDVRLLMGTIRTLRGRLRRTHPGDR